MTDYTKLSRTDWLELAERFYVRLERTFASFGSAEWERTSPYLGWRAKDVLAHMTSAMPVNFRQVLDRALGGNPSAPLEFDTFARNAREVARRRAVPPAELAREFRAELDAIMSIYRGLSDADWVRPAWFFVGRVNVRTLFLVQFADNVVHERDLLVVNRRWNGFAPEFAAPLVDWFLREFRTATFRPERADGLQAKVLYRLAGPSGGNWTLEIRSGACWAAQGAAGTADIVIDADADDLVVAAQGRTAPWVGRLARAIDWIWGPARAEDVVAQITGTASLLWAVAKKRIRVNGDPALARRVDGAFWHFGQRTLMTAANIARG